MLHLKKQTPHGKHQIQSIAADCRSSLKGMGAPVRPLPPQTNWRQGIGSAERSRFPGNNCG